MNAQEICYRIRAARELQGISQATIAKSLGLSQSAYAKMESGYTKLCLDRFLEIALFLEIAPADLLKRRKKSAYPTPPSRSKELQEPPAQHLYLVSTLKNGATGQVAHSA